MEISEAISAIDSDSYKVTFLERQVGRVQTVSEKEFLKIIEQISSDTYITKAISILVPKLQVSITPVFAKKILDCVSSDTYIVSSLGHMIPKLIVSGGDAIVKILDSISSDTYIVSGAKLLEKKLGNQKLSASTMASLMGATSSDNYTVEILKIFANRVDFQNPRDFRSVIDCLDSDHYKKRALDHLQEIKKFDVTPSEMGISERTVGSGSGSIINSFSSSGGVTTIRNTSGRMIINGQEIHTDSNGNIDFSSVRFPHTQNIVKEQIIIKEVPQKPLPTPEALLKELKKSKEGDSNVCTICEDNIRNWSLECGHVFCGECVWQLLYKDDSQSICPNCRKPSGCPHELFF